MERTDKETIYTLIVYQQISADNSTCILAQHETNEVR